MSGFLAKLLMLSSIKKICNMKFIRLTKPGLDMDHYNTVVQKFEFWTCDFVEAGPIESSLLVNSQLIVGWLVTSFSQKRL